MRRLLSFIILVSASVMVSRAQTAPDSLFDRGTLPNCIQYALTHQPSLQKSFVDEKIAEHEIWGKLADWFPQLNLSFNVQHDPQIPVTIVGSAPVNQGLANNSNIQVTATQTLFNRDVLLASTSAGDVRTFARQKTSSTKIDVVVNVSKAYYAVLVTKQQIKLLDEDILRLVQSSKDAYLKYQSGIVDKTDYMRAQIALNNAQADRKQTAEILQARLAVLKEQMGYPAGENLELDDNGINIESDALIDTNQSLSYMNRIEFQILETQKHLQEDNVNYNAWSFLPSINLYGGYTINYQNSFVDRLYNQQYPYSFVGLQASFPLFQGGKRIQQIKIAKLQLDQFDYDAVSLKSSINTQYVLALANYKSNLNDYKSLTDNLRLAQDVYQTIQLQYKDGTKSYLEFITAETDLRTAQVNQTNALYQLLISKLDVQKALGTISY
jgi:outer membrane protein